MVSVYFRNKLEKKEMQDYIQRNSKKTYPFSVTLSINRYEMIRSCCKGIVLECGSGTGWGTHFLSNSPKVEFLIAIDIDLRKLIFSKKNQSPAHHIMADIHYLPVRDETIDSIVSSEVIEHVNIFGVVEEMKRVIRNEGFVLLSTPNRGFILKRLQEVNHYHIHEFTPSEISSLGTKKGFDVTKVIGTYIQIPVAPRFLETISSYLYSSIIIRKFIVTSLRNFALISIRIGRTKFSLPLSPYMFITMKKRI